jgi:transposase InsO family protein
MPWYKETVMSQRREFIGLIGGSVKMSDACRRFGISRTTGYKWLDRFKAEGDEGLGDRSRRPSISPSKTPDEVERLILRARTDHPAWGGRKLKRWLENRGAENLPSPSTITEILRRHGRIDPEESRKRGPFQRFEYPQPNDLWQMDFKGYFQMGPQACHPLTVLDDHSRFAIALQACEGQTRPLVKRHLKTAFEAYGLPKTMLVDNGSPWSGATHEDWTRLSVWLLRLGVDVIRSRVRHPQTLGKDERFHKSLLLECIRDHPFSTFDQVQSCFNQWRDVYNFERPHESLGMNTPASRYTTSSRPYPSKLPPIEYDPQDQVRKVNDTGRIAFNGRDWRVGKAFCGYPVAVRPGRDDGQLLVVFCGRVIKEIDLRSL